MQFCQKWEYPIISREEEIRKIEQKLSLSLVSTRRAKVTVIALRLPALLVRYRGSVGRSVATNNNNCGELKSCYDTERAGRYTTYSIHVLHYIRSCMEHCSTIEVPPEGSGRSFWFHNQAMK